MKKSKISIILILVILLTSCVKYDLQMQVDTDKSFNFVLIDAMLKDYAGSATQDQSEIDAYKAKGFSVEDYSDSEYTGYSISKKFNSIDEVSSPTCTQIELTDVLQQENMLLFKSQKNGSITTYTADFTYDLTADTSEESEEVDYSQYSESMYFGYKITLPKNANIISNNADIVSTDGYTLTWEMEYGKKKDIDFVFTIDDKDVTGTPSNNQDTNDNNNNNNNNPPKQEVDEELPPEEELEVKVSFSSIIALIVVLGVIGGLIYLKYKTSAKARFSKKNINNPSVLYHATPPNNKKDK